MKSNLLTLKTDQNLLDKLKLAAGKKMTRSEIKRQMASFVRGQSGELRALKKQVIKPAFSERLSNQL